MRKFSVLAATLLATAAVASPQGRPIDWPSFGGDAQRTGWQKSDLRITKDNVKDFELVLKRKLDNKRAGPYALAPPVVIGNLISYRGFKELAFVAGSSGEIWSIDADMDRIFWQRQIGPVSGDSACADRVAGIPALTPPLNFAARPRAAGTARPAAAPAAPMAPGRAGGTGFGSPRSVFTLGADGKMYQLNSATGEDQFPPTGFLPPGAKASSLTIQDGVLYTTTSSGCGSSPNAVWALDLNSPDPKPVSFTSKTGSIGGIGGFALGADGTVFVQTGSGETATLLALTAKDLKLKQSFTGAGNGSVTPVVFTWKNRQIIVSAGKNGSLYLFDAQTLGGDDYKTALYESAPLSSSGVWGGLSTWEDTDGTRWVLAPVWGPLISNLKALLTGGDAPNGSIVAFKVEEQDGKPMLTPAWASRDMKSPEPPVITSGVVFALSAGSDHATLYALDGATGKEMYSSGSQVNSPGNLTGLTLANGRIYFTTNDNTLYAFGIHLER